LRTIIVIAEQVYSEREERECADADAGGNHCACSTGPEAWRTLVVNGPIRVIHPSRRRLDVVLGTVVVEE
jgi:hypothetical protein